MSVPSETEPDKDKIRAKILGFGEQSIHKSYYPQLQARIQELEESQARLEEKSAALRVSEEKYRHIIEAIPLGMHMYRLEEDNRLVFSGANPAADRILKIDHSQFIGQTFEQIFPNLIETEIPEQYRRVAATGQTWQIDQIVYADERVNGVLEVHAFQTSPGHMTAAFLDITERKQAEEKFLQAQKMEAIGRLTAGVAHDFNNLLTVINGYSELLLSRLTNRNDSLHHDLEQVRQAGKRAETLTRQLLAFSRKQVLQPQVINLNTIISDLDKMLRRLIGEDINLITLLPADLGLVKADPGQLEQVVINLAVNARDAMPNGGHLVIETANVVLDGAYTAIYPDMQPGQYALMVISDNGVGMSEGVKAHLFEPFFTTKEQGKGTGLGLAAVYGIIKQSDGHITVYSEVDLGSTFRIYLPRIEAMPQAELATETQRVALSGDETILLAEDDPVVRSLARHMLEDQGYTILEAGSGSEALQLAQRYPGSIDMLLTDVIMPDLNGKALAAELSRLRPGLKVLFMSGYTDDAIVHHGVLGPHVAFLPKPFNHLALVGKVRAVLDASLA